MLLPLTTVVLFATNQKTAAFVLLGFTIVVGAALVARIVQIMGQRRRRQQQYGRLDPAEEEGGGEIAMVSLGAALGLSPASGSGSGRSRGGQGRGARYHSSLLHPAARHNPTALRLAMADRDFGPNDYDLLLRLDSEHQAQVFTGIPASQIQRLPTWRVPKATPGAAATASKENVCAVCLEDKVEGEMVRTLPCLHAFHVPSVRSPHSPLSQPSCASSMLTPLSLTCVVSLSQLHRSVAAITRQMPCVPIQSAVSRLSVQPSHRAFALHSPLQRASFAVTPCSRVLLFSTRIIICIARKSRLFEFIHRQIIHFSKFKLNRFE